MLKKQVLLISIIYTVALTAACLMRLNNLPTIKVSSGDKIFHFLAYLVLTFLWVNTFIYKFKWKKETAIIYGATICIVFGIVIEVLQGSLTSYRSSDFFVFLANLSVFFVMFIIFTIKKNRTIKK